ncbi:Disks large-associated protein like [Actinidia chinensis var. chinensis]|uniref:Disks large-associated protein like n=1 Tax=Actinidia chinensis var. chinensis TaxID=1590841 RepID=A0A2R6Q3X8_ACTCC|nr:Disks large-associated protein like [Actinidia chinensis var. chinensis]
MHFQTEVPAPSHLGALLPLTGVRCKVRRFASRRDSISPPLYAQLERSPSLILSERDSFRRRHACRCTSTLSLSSELLHGHPALVAPSRVWPDFRTYPKASPCAPVPLWILQVHPSGTPALALRASVQRLLLSSIHLANTTGPMSDNSSSCLDTPLSRYSLPVFLLLQLLLFPLETLSVPPLASKLHRFDSCISMKHALPRSPSWISRLPCGTGLSFANNRVVSHPNKSLACYMCREHLSVSAQVVSNS